ncbi:MAG: hypothetical protein SH819_03295 [Cytophagales bacterium]|nr:hypothetical protein [Cytophagales bacterium]
MKRIILMLSIIGAGLPLFAQEAPKEKDELRVKLNEDGSHYLKFTFLNQVWFRFNDSNPGTLVQGEAESNTFDVGLRRTRFQFYGQLTDHVFFYFQYGQNNFNGLAQNAGNRKLQAFFHDAIGEYKIKKGSEALVLGGGLTIANGLSRFSQPSIGTIMTMDVPVFAQATVDQTDEFSRKLSVYARGQLGRLDYRLILSDPFPITTNGTIAAPVAVSSSSNASFAQVGHHKQYQGFFMWNFLDKESHVTPYMTGTYLGKKKVLNLEGGFITQKKALWTGDGVTNTFHDMNLWSVAGFYDAPLNTEKGTAISAYVGYFNYNFGPGYLRYNGIMNPANGLSSATPAFVPGSQGNAFPMFGTGNVVYSQVGYLMKKDLLGTDHGMLMPYVSLMQAHYDRLDKPMAVWDVGVNWFIKGHSSKLTLDYQHRPIYLPNGNDFYYAGSRGQVVLQYQIFF